MESCGEERREQGSGGGDPEAEEEAEGARAGAENEARAVANASCGGGQATAVAYTGTLRGRWLIFFDACLQVAEQSVKCFQVGVVVLPIAEVGDEILANFTSGILADVGIEVLPIAQ
jgi:hypothetical protein